MAYIENQIYHQFFVYRHILFIYIRCGAFNIDGWCFCFCYIWMMKKKNQQNFLYWILWTKKTKEIANEWIKILQYTHTDIRIRIGKDRNIINACRISHVSHTNIVGTWLAFVISIVRCKVRKTAYSSVVYVSVCACIGENAFSEGEFYWFFVFSRITTFILVAIHPVCSFLFSAVL